jgi:putative FmdB family regulatory protein
MPIYEYRCASCGHQQESLQKVSDPPLTVCPKCGKPELAKMLTAAGFQLKGSGWYATDFRNKGAPPAKPAEGSKTDAKPAEGSKSDAKAPESSKGESGGSSGSSGGSSGGSPASGGSSAG